MRRRWWTSWLALLVLAALLAACAGGAGPAPTPTATRMPVAKPTPTATPTATPTRTPDPTAFKLVYRKFGPTSDFILKVSPRNLARTELLAEVPHAQGFGIVASLSPGGKAVAYTVMPEGARDPEIEAQAYVQRFDGREPKFLIDGLDLRTPPVWSPDGRFVLVRRNTPSKIILIRVQLKTGKVTVGLEITRGLVFDIFPIGFVLRESAATPTPPTRPIALLYFAQLTINGTAFASFPFAQAVPTPTPPAPTPTPTVTPTPTATKTPKPTGKTPKPRPTPTPTPTLTPTPTPFVLVWASDQVARDYALSPDDKRMAFLVPRLKEGEPIIRTFYTDLELRTVAQVPAAELRPGDHLNPIWTVDSSAVSIGLLPLKGKPRGVAIVPVLGGNVKRLPPPKKGFDVPASWSPDGRYLAVRSFSGKSIADPGRSRLVLISRMSGGRFVVTAGDVDALGWVERE
ncbi:MAG: PD40 domain-containing protein [Chloroflexi bacterium]|nr:PD40 domain-containing protein [Chloroflexota bacterium]